MKQIFTTAIIDWLKTNGHRIADHKYSRQTAPLASRADIKPFLELVKGEHLDILTLDSEKKLTFLAINYEEELMAHGSGDAGFFNAFKTVFEANPEARLMYVVSGIVMPQLAQQTTSGLSVLAEYVGKSEDEIRPLAENTAFFSGIFNLEKAIKLPEHKAYLRTIISKMRKIHSEFTESEFNCPGCSTQYVEGKYSLGFWEKEKQFDFYICPECGTIGEPDTNLDRAVSFAAGLH